MRIVLDVVWIASVMMTGSSGMFTTGWEPDVYSTFHIIIYNFYITIKTTTKRLVNNYQV